MTQILSAPAFDERIATRSARVGIVGLGYAGLPLAMAFAEAGFDVTGIDLSRERVDAIAERRSYLVDVPAERYDAVDGKLRATTDYAAVSELDALTICVPTPLSKTRTPDLSYVVAAAESVAEQLSPGQLVILQSTTYPGTTEQVIRPILERAGAVVGTDFFLGYAPERVDPGNRQWNVHTTPKLVGGVTDECLRRTKLLYETIVQTVVPVSSPMVAETAKLHENTFRAVNIALANELALMCDKLGISAVGGHRGRLLQAVRVPAALPGAGPRRRLHPGRAALPRLATARVRLLRAADRRRGRGQRDDAQLRAAEGRPTRSTTTRRPIKGSRILLLGVTYKADVADTRESPSLEVLRQLAHRGADVRYCDPHIPALELDEQPYASVAVDRRGGRRCRLRRHAHRAPRVPRRPPLGGRAASSWTRATWSRAARTSSRSEWPTDAADPRRRLHRRGGCGARPRARRGGRAGRQLARDAPRAARRARARRRAGGDRRHPRPRRARRAARRRPPARAAARRPGEPADLRARPRLHGGRRTSPAHGASPRRSPPRAPRELVHGSSLHVYGSPLAGEIGPGAPYGEQGDLAHLSKIYAELALGMHARRGGFGLANCRLGIVYGPSPVEHDAPDSQTVIDKFRRLAAAGEPLTLDGGGRATIGAVHVADAARLLLDCAVPPARRGRRLQPRRRDADRGRRRRARRGPRAARRRRVDASRRS